MGLFGKGGQRGKKRAGGTTIIATGTTLAGDVKPDGNLHIDGHVEGRIHSEADVSIGTNGTFEGDIKAQRMVVSGFARGRVECDSLEIVAQGKVLGEVASRAFVIEPGGQFVGESRSTDEEAVAALSHWKQSLGSDGDTPPEPVQPRSGAAFGMDSGPVPDEDPFLATPSADEREPGLADFGPEQNAPGDDLDSREPTFDDQTEQRPDEGWVADGERRWR